MDTKLPKLVSLCDANPSSAQTGQSLPAAPDTSETLPPCSLGEHVVKRREYLIPTPPIKAAFNIAYQLISARHRGVAFIGPSRIGKTCAMSYLVTALRPLFPDRLFFIYGAWEHHRPTPDAHYVDLLIGLGAKGATSGKNDGRREQVINQLWVPAAESHSSHLVLLIDEAQNLHMEELGGLKNVCVELERSRHLRVATLLWGQVQLEYERSALAAQRREDIKARFMSPVFPFHGMRSVGELREVLETYDDNSEYPTGSAITFTQFFFPRAYAAGWRLASTASSLWHAIAKATGVNADELEVGMDGISAAVERFFDTHHDEDRENWRPDPNYWDEAVKFSGLSDLPAMAHTSKASGG